MKEKILTVIYDNLDQWQSSQTILQPACTNKCSSCCTRNVIVTALEAEKILHYVQENQLIDWFVDKLSSEILQHGVSFTTNDLALACMENGDLQESKPKNTGSCPFLQNDLCAVYAVRPLACRLQISSTRCSENHPAQLPDGYLDLANVLLQLVEHLGQKEYYGNMLDVLPALLDISKYEEIGRHVEKGAQLTARLRTLSARPLPGFLYTEESAKLVEPLLTGILNTEINSKRIEDILNGR